MNEIEAPLTNDCFYNPSDYILDQLEATLNTVFDQIEANVDYELGCFTHFYVNIKKIWSKKSFGVKKCA